MVEVGFVTGLEINNKMIVGSHSELGPVGEVPPAVVVAALLDGAGLELIAGYVSQVCCQSSDHQR